MRHLAPTAHITAFLLLIVGGISVFAGEMRTSRYTYTGGVKDGKQNGYGVC